MENFKRQKSKREEKIICFRSKETFFTLKRAEFTNDNKLTLR